MSVQVANRTIMTDGKASFVVQCQHGVVSAIVTGSIEDDSTMAEVGRWAIAGVKVEKMNTGAAIKAMKKWPCKECRKAQDSDDGN